ncbi:MAG: RecX family transcriptional regulator [Candidatus Izemoplasmatales bacterium]|nr:RecX family transcriptional regulator [Candidatus Izemoplasmatales bacterium]MDD3865299.1 RecX family transcriptional regulator [Candidatus Izemoplasmatales bacterium]
MITVQNLKKSNNRYTVTFQLNDSSAAVFLVSEDLVVEYRLIPGKILEDFAFQSFKKAADIDEYFHKAMNYAVRYPQTEATMKKYLENRMVPDDKIISIIAKLKQIGIIDDEVFTINYVENHFRFHHEGKIKIRFDLRGKGVCETIIEKGINTIGNQAETTAMEILFDRKLSSLKSKPLRKGMLLMTHYLVGKGYDRSISEAFVMAKANQFHNSIEEIDLIRKDYVKICKHLGITKALDHSQKEKVIKSLMAKGYSYFTIKNLIESGSSDDESTV